METTPDYSFLLSYESGGSMIAIRLYVAALTVTFLLCSVLTTGIGVLHATVLVCAVVYSILEVREELKDLRALEAQVSSLSR
jgi:hypothetical protein